MNSWFKPGDNLGACVISSSTTGTVQYCNGSRYAWACTTVFQGRHLTDAGTGSEAASSRPGVEEAPEGEPSTCRDLDTFAAEPSTFVHLNLARSKALTQAGKLDELVTALLSDRCRLLTLDLSCNNFGAAGAVLSHPLR